MQRSRDEADGFSTDSDSHSENFGLYSCLCMNSPLPSAHAHQSISDSDVEE